LLQLLGQLMLLLLLAPRAALVLLVQGMGEVGVGRSASGAVTLLGIPWLLLLMLQGGHPHLW
jgi:hypothetical protein